MVQQTAHSLPLLAFGGFEGNFKLFDTESLVILRELCVFSDMGGKETVSNLVIAITKAHLHRTSEAGRSLSLPENTRAPAERSSRCVRAADRDRFVLFSPKNSTEGNYFFETETGIPTAAIPTPTMARLCVSLRRLTGRSSVKDLGIHSVEFSQDDRFVALKENSRASILWVWDVKRDCLAVNVVFKSPILAFAWSPQQSRLAIVTSNLTLYLWEPGEITWSIIPNRGGWERRSEV